ncbi:hypothetical protein BJ138DRAFT_1155743 [Hygrophoropsis aurantiaca]|uniref:Uncharacterized protein n=1 Tax=Hygrophoropsis aurantiaca TaxID=72124 RepID=A0ACB8A849_9AGAM|nr:hypothetical protein BJ138DRAFT_1155743 [Hygrophoropsis aurantiaca]
MSSGQTAQDPTWKSREQGEESRYIHEKEQAQLAALAADQKQKQKDASSSDDRDFEGGFGGQEDLEDRYATTSGEH